MTRDIYILIAFCVFLFMVGIRLRQRWNNRKKNVQSPPLCKNQRPKAAASLTEEPPLVKERRLRRERRTRLFTFILLFVLFGLLIFMIPALLRDIAVSEGIDFSNLFLRCLIFVFTIYIFILAYLKLFRKKKKVNQE